VVRALEGILVLRKMKRGPRMLSVGSAFDVFALLALLMTALGARYQFVGNRDEQQVRL
jgi:hypothetical protein